MGGQVWGTSALGGYLALPDLSKKVRHIAQPLMKFRQFARPEPGFGAHKGESFKFDTVSNVATSGGTIAELNKMPETSVTIGQGTVTVTEYGNSIPWTFKLQQLADLDVNNIVVQALKNDMAKVLDAAVATEFKTCQIKYAPTGTVAAPTATWDTDGTISTAATRNIQAFDIKEIIDGMKSTYLIPKYDGENYVCICSVGFARQLKDDPDWEDAAKYGDPQRLFAGEVGRYYGCRFIEETNALSNTIGSYKGEAIFFGEDPIVEGVAQPEELRAKVSTDYGRDQGMAWYAILGWSLTYDTNTAGEARVVHVTST